VHSAPPRPKTPTDVLRSRLRDTAMTAERGTQATLAEVFSEQAVDGAPIAFAVAHLRADKPVLWVQDRMSRRETGRPYLAGLPVPLRILHVTVSKPADLLWTMEEALGCPALGGVLGEVWGDPAVLDFTATKRLALRSEAHGVPAWLIRRAAHPNLSAARERWRVDSLPSLPDPDDQRAPGLPLWQADLFRSRWRQPGQWVVRHDQDGLSFEHGVDRPDVSVAPHDTAPQSLRI
jgi:protein ImuA